MRFRKQTLFTLAASATAIALFILAAAACAITPHGESFNAAGDALVPTSVPTPHQMPSTPSPTITPTATPSPTINPYSFVKVGNTIQFGKYLWRVLDVQDGRALIITEDIVDKQPYHVIYEDVTWEDCSLRKYLNEDFYDSFSAEERSLILETNVHNPDNLWYGTKGGNDTRDFVFLLSLEELDKYLGDSGDYLNKVRKAHDGELFPSRTGWYLSNTHDGERKAAYDGDKWYYWLRSPGRIASYAAYVNYDGWISVSGRRISGALNGVRPALWLDAGG